MKPVVAFLCLLSMGASGSAADLRPFDEGSLATIRETHAGRPFVLVLWSVHCPPCRDEMALIRDRVASRPGVAAVFVSTDPPAEHAAAQALWDAQGMDGHAGWAFAHDYLERLRWSIDPAWAGELPRLYRYEADHSRRGHSGRIEPGAFEAWMRSVAPPP